MAEEPYFQFHIFACTNRRDPGHARGSCASKGGEELRDYFKSRVKALNIPNTRVNTAGCLDRCELGPVLVVYPEGIWYRCPTKEAIDEVVNSHLIGGKVVEHLKLDRRQKRLDA